MLKSLMTQACAVLLNIQEKPKLNMFNRDGMLFTPVLLFVTVLMIDLVSSTPFHAPISRDPSIYSVVEYTREAEIKSVY